MERAGSNRLTTQRPVKANARLAGLAFLAVLAASAMSGCQNKHQSFAGLLARIDASGNAAPLALYHKAAVLAASTDERLRILKRGLRCGQDCAVDVVTTVIASGGITEPVALVALDVYLDAGKYDEALALFDGPLDARSHGAELAEAMVMSSRAGVSIPQPADAMVACFDATGNPSFMIAAAVDAMRRSDPAAAFALLQGVPGVPYRLLWDTGDVASLAARVPSSTDPLESNVCADAAHRAGLDAVATQLYTELVDAYPSWSWKPYAALARIAETEPADAQPLWPHIPAADSYAAQSAPGVVADRLYRLIAERFPGSDDARIEQARRLYSLGRAGEASALLAGVGGEAGAIARLRFGERDRAVPLALELASAYGDSPAAIDAALSALAGAGSWDRYRQLLRRAGQSGIELPRSWFWSALDRTLDGDFAGAASALRAGGPASAGYAGAFDLGIMELAASRPAAAIDALSIAAGMARSDDERATAYLVLGDAFVAADLGSKAAAAYTKVLDIDPASRLARSRLERIHKP